MAKSRKGKPKQEPPVAFRPGPELERMVSAFASKRGVGVNDAYKHLAALAVVGLDGGYYDLLTQMASRMTGQNTFVRAVIEVHTALTATVRIAPLYANEPERTLLVIQTVMEQVPGVDQKVWTEVAGPLLARLKLSGADTPKGPNEVEEETPLVTDLDRQKVRVALDD